jgi:hypothetical protein
MTDTDHLLPAQAHTPGPWEPHWHKDKWIIGDPATFTHLAGIYRNKKEDANARLIAAAPELLEALDHLHWMVCLQKCNDPVKYALRKAAAALAKATGRAA